MLFRLFGYLFGIGAVMFLAVAGVIAWYVTDKTKDLPDYDVLAQYEPLVMTRVHASDGQLVAEYAREKRLFLPIEAVPDLVKAAFLSAEDKNFYVHGGLDYNGIARAIVQNVRNIAAGRRRFVGASTITQQVAKNFLLTTDQTIDRKIKEAALALRIEGAYTKDRILELYLNEIFLGLGAYGIAAASLEYFDKSVHELTLAEAAYLAALPKGPNNYHPHRREADAIERRNWVIDRMVENQFVTPEQAATAKAAPLGVVRNRSTQAQTFAADYYTEQVRRQLKEMFGDDILYGGGLSVRTSLDPAVQVMARQALVNGLVAYDEGRGWRGPVDQIDVSGDWVGPLTDVDLLDDVVEWRMAVVLQVSASEAEIGLRPDTGGGIEIARDTGKITLDQVKWAKWAEGDRKGREITAVSDVLSVGDVVYVEPAEEIGAYRLRQPPFVQGAIMVMAAQTGRVLGMVGGFSYSESEFNRAMQARRQPGSAIKPVVYAAALDNGYTPSSVVMDAPVEYDQGGSLGIWKPTNYSDKYYGPSTLRSGIERSQNVMTVRLALDMGIPLVSEYGRRFGIYDEDMINPSAVLGSKVTAVDRMVAGYAVFANGGREVRPTLIDRIQDRYGNTIFRYEDRICEGCVAGAWAGQDEPLIVDKREQILDPMTAYQMTSMLEGVVQHGTATVLKEVGKPVAGKTGTTNDYIDAWFVGYTPDLVVGVYVGYDNNNCSTREQLQTSRELRACVVRKCSRKDLELASEERICSRDGEEPRKLGRSGTGGQLAAPIVKDFLQMALIDEPATPFRVPQGMEFYPIDRRTGLRAQPGQEGVILEPFKPGTLPPDSYSIIGYTDTMGRPLTVAPEADRAVISGTGGLY